MAQPSMPRAALEHLFITSITPAKPAPGRDPRLGGAVFVTRPGVIGLAEPLFKPSTQPTHHMGAC